MYIHCNLAKELRQDSVCDAACIHMYLGHPTDNVQIKSFKKYDAWKQMRWKETLQVLDTNSKAVLNYYVIVTHSSTQVHVRYII